MNGKAYLPYYLMIINTSEIDYKLGIPSVELEGFEELEELEGVDVKVFGERSEALC